MDNRVLVFFVLVFSFFCSQKWAYTASCCGSSNSLPSILVTDDQSILQAQLGNSASTNDANRLGEKKTYDSRFIEVNESFSVKAAHRLGELWQVGVDTSLISNMRKSPNFRERSIGFGDTQIQAVYEFMPAYEYHPWKPIGFLFLQVVAPTGQAVFESQKPMQTDSFGEGFWKTGLGFAFHRAWNSFDAQFVLDGKYLFSRTLGNDFYQPGPVFQSLLSMGYSPEGTDFRFGTGVNVQYKTEKKNGFDTSPASMISTVLFNAAYRFERFSLSLAYYDQNILPARNAVLARGATLTYTHFFAL